MKGNTMANAVIKKNLIVSTAVYNSSMVGGNFTDKAGKTWKIVDRRSSPKAKGNPMLSLKLEMAL
jgi:translation elongation factor P/translation initiation factor 5A